jgi:hypothetical protein
LQASRIAHLYCSENGNALSIQNERAFDIKRLNIHVLSIIFISQSTTLLSNLEIPDLLLATMPVIIGGQGKDFLQWRNGEKRE